jgi:hypothetical protein
LIQSLGLSFTVATIAQALSLAAGVAFALGDVGASTAALAPALLGVAAGRLGAGPGQREDVPAGLLRRIARAPASPGVARADVKIVSSQQALAAGAAAEIVPTDGAMM